MKSDLHEIFSILHNLYPELINNVRARARAHARVHAQDVETCTQLWAKNKPSYFRQMKSDLHETFSVLQDWSPELINNVCARAHVHAQHMELYTRLGAKTKPSYFR